MVFSTKGTVGSHPPLAESLLIPLHQENTPIKFLSSKLSNKFNVITQ